MNFLLTPYDPKGLKPDISGRARSTPVYQYDYEELDNFVDSVNDDDSEKEEDFLDDVDLSKKLNTNYLGGTDSYVPRGSRSYHVGGNIVYEYSGNHRNYARKGISPFKQPKHSGGPMGTGGAGQAFRTTGNFVGIGTQYGSSRPHKILTDIEDENLWDISKIKDPMERSFIRHNNRVKKVLNLIKEYLLYEIN